MKIWILVVVFCLFHSNAFAQDMAQLQRGAILFINYCSGCHSLKYTSYQRISRDLGLPKNSDISFQSTILKQDALHWFGMLPPDLSLTARAKGQDWIKNYLISFYPDKTRPFGVNNVLLIDTSMPDVLSPLKKQSITKEDSQSITMVAQDISVFLSYVAEPASLIRYRIGCFVLCFLLLFGVILFNLK